MEPELQGRSELLVSDLDVAAGHVGMGWDSLRGKSIFFTGGSGFVGKWMLATLSRARQTHELDCRVTLLSRTPENFARKWSNFFDASWMTLCKGDVRDFAFPPGIHEVVIHAAADVAQQSDPQKLLDSCRDGTARVLDFAARSQTERFHLVSSGAVYGRQSFDVLTMSESQPWTTALLGETDAYTEGKRQAELLVKAAIHQQGLSATISRCFATVGPLLPLDGRFAIGNFIRDVLCGRDIQLSSDGTSVRSYLYAADLAGWLWSIILRGNPGAIYNVGSSEEISIRELAVRVTAVLGSNVSVHVGDSAAPSQRFVPNVSRIGRELGLLSTVDLDEAIRKTAWHYYLPGVKR